MSNTAHAANAAASAASKAMYGGAATAAASGLIGSSPAATIGGLVLGGLGFLVNWIYKHRADQRHQKLYETKMAALAKGELDTDRTELDESKEP